MLSDPLKWLTLLVSVRLIALMLGRLQMTMEEALEAYWKTARSVFSKGNKKLNSTKSTFKATTLESNIKEIVAKRKLGERMLNEANDMSMGKAFVCATPAQDLSKPRRFRTYQVREHASPNCFIWQAARATTAAPTFFKPIDIGNETIVDAGLGCNNPTDYVLKEALAVYGQEAELSCLISIGTGHPGVIGLSKHDTLQRWLPIALAKKLGDIVTDCEQVTRVYEEKFNAFLNCFFRFNVTHGAGEVSLEEWENMGKIETFTKTYLEDVAVSKSIDVVVNLLCQREDVRTVYPSLGSLC